MGVVRSIGGLIIFAVLLAGLSCQKKVEQDAAALVTAAGKPFITKDDLTREFSKFLPDKKGLSSDSIRRMKTALLERMVEERLILEEAKRLGITVTDSEVGAEADRIRKDYPEDAFQDLPKAESFDLKAWKEQIRRRIKINKTIRRCVLDSIVVSESQLKAYYNGHKELFYQNVQVRVRQILLQTEQEALKILKRVTKKNFPEMARRYSTSPEAKNGGDLGFFHPGEMPKELDEVVFSMPVGKISKVIRTPYGFHILLVEERRPAYRQPFSEVRDQIARHIRKRLEEAAYREWIDRLMKKAGLAFHLERIEKMPASPATGKGEG